MAEKKSFALRVDPEMMKAMEKWAADEFRSVNGQIEWVLHRALKEAGRIRRDEGAGLGAGPAAEGSAESEADKGPPDER